MGIRKRGKTWWVDITAPSGERVRRSTQTEDRREAQEYHDRLKAELWRVDKLKEQPRRTWDEAALRWLDEKAHKATLGKDEETLRWLQGILRGKILGTIDRALIDKIIKERKTGGVSSATVNRTLALVRSILKKCIEWEWLETVPVVKLLPEPKRRIRWLTRTEACRLLAALPPHQRAIADFALQTGLRQANIVGLEWNQIDMGRRTAWIHPDQAKARKAIAVPLNNDAFRILSLQQGKHPDRVFTFEGRPIDQVNTKAWRKALKKVGIENFRWHDLRHTWASWHVQAGTPLHVIQELGGWESFEMVRRYAHLSGEHLEKWAGNLNLGTNPSQGVLQIVK